MKDQPDPNQKLSHAQTIALAVVARLAKETAEFERIVQAQGQHTAKMLAQDIGLEIDQVVTYDGELAVIRCIMLDPSDVAGVRFEIVSYLDDDKYAIVRSSQLKA